MRIMFGYTCWSRKKYWKFKIWRKNNNDVDLIKMQNVLKVQSNLYNKHPQKDFTIKITSY